MRTILGEGGRVRGRILETSTGKTLLSSSGEVLGYYNEDTDQTLLPGGRLHAYGDCLMELLEE